jgi:hypothetical protein
MRKEIMSLLDASRARRAEREAARQAEKERMGELIKAEEAAAASNTPDLGPKAVAFEDGEGNVIGELMEGQPSTGPKDKWYRKLWKSLF